MGEKHGPNGLLLGLLVGGAVGALVSSKKGRQILKDLAEYGLEYVGKTIDMEDIKGILNNDEEEVMAGEMETAKMNEEAAEPSRRKRLFRGIRRK